MAVFIVTLAILAAWRSLKVPPKAPMAVLHADTITTSFMSLSLSPSVEHSNQLAQIPVGLGKTGHDRKTSYGRCRPLVKISGSGFRGTKEE
jgi:hypothetical protein